jgi:hypothetical protein
MSDDLLRAADSYRNDAETPGAHPANRLIVALAARMRELQAERDALRSALHAVCDAFLTTDQDYAAMRMHQIAHAALREGKA